MKHWKQLAGLTLVILAIAAVAYRLHVRIEAWIWHAKHGTQMVFGDYIVPVPANWYVKTQKNGDQLLVDLQRNTDGPPDEVSIPSTILVFHDATKDLKSWTAVNTALLKERGITPVQQTFSVNGETFLCIGGDKLDSVELKSNTVNVWRCRSAGQLGILIAVGRADTKQIIWGIISNIRKRS